MGLFSFRKEEKLHKKKYIEILFKQGFSFSCHPFKVLFLPHPDPLHPFHQVLISVSSRNFKRAVDRNLIKRRMREAYRLQKVRFSPKSKLVIAFLYTSREIHSFQEIKDRMLLAMAKIEKMERTQVRKE